MSTLNDEVKLYIVQQLACHNSPTQTANDVYEEFGIKLERGNIQKYDPTKAAGKQLSKKYKEIFQETRKKFLGDISMIPIASQAVRLNELSISHKYFKSKKNFIAANQVLEQVAKEVNGFYTSRFQSPAINEKDLFITWLKSIGNSSPPIVYEVSNLNKYEQNSQNNELRETLEIAPLENKIKWQRP